MTAPRVSVPEQRQQQQQGHHTTPHCCFSNSSNNQGLEAAAKDFESLGQIIIDQLALQQGFGQDAALPS